jgi:hypothetical protein
MAFRYPTIAGIAPSCPRLARRRSGRRPSTPCLRRGSIAPILHSVMTMVERDWQYEDKSSRSLRVRRRTDQATGRNGPLIAPENYRGRKWQCEARAPEDMPSSDWPRRECRGCGAAGSQQRCRGEARRPRDLNWSIRRKLRSFRRAGRGCAATTAATTRAGETPADRMTDPMRTDCRLRRR